MLTLFLEILLNGIILVHKPCMDFFIYNSNRELKSQARILNNLALKKIDGESKRSEIRPFHFFF